MADEMFFVRLYAWFNRVNPARLRSEAKLWANKFSNVNYAAVNRARLIEFGGMISFSSAAVSIDFDEMNSPISCTVESISATRTSL